MYKIKNELYALISEALEEQIDSPNLFNANIELSYNDINIRFIATLIPFFRQEYQDGVNIYVLYNLIPVWWELHTVAPEGEIINDFDFEILKNMICQ